MKIKNQVLKPDLVWAALVRMNGSGFNHAEAQPGNAENNNDPLRDGETHNASI